VEIIEDHNTVRRALGDAEINPSDASEASWHTW